MLINIQLKNLPKSSKPTWGWWESGCPVESSGSWRERAAGEHPEFCLRETALWRSPLPRRAPEGTLKHQSHSHSLDTWTHQSGVQLVFCMFCSHEQGLDLLVNGQQGGTEWTLSVFAGDTKLGGEDGQADGAAAIQREPGTADREQQPALLLQSFSAAKKRSLWLSISALLILGKREVTFGICSNECARATPLPTA